MAEVPKGDANANSLENTYLSSEILLSLYIRV